ncbi:MAG: carboxypeptidase-like regulatory domain-containing protein [candidate division WOR-3 bacterium]
MKKLLTLMSVMVLAGAVLAQTGGISGKVVDAQTGNPIAGAVVVACHDSTPAGRALTNGDGWYLIENLEPGGYRVIARAQNYQASVYPERVIVRSGQVTQDINFRLNPIPRPQFGAIAGRVVDARTQKPVRGALVVATGEGWRYQARTDGHGNYLIRRVRPGTYQVGAKARGYLGQRYPEPVVVRPGEVTQNINFALEPAPARGAITGQVVDGRTNLPIAGALVVARGEHGAGQARTNGHGFYRILLYPGEYQVTAQARGYETEVFPRPVPVRSNEVTEHIDFSLHRLKTDSD